jgi:hypothetical protein
VAQPESEKAKNNNRASGAALFIILLELNDCGAAAALFGSLSPQAVQVYYFLNLSAAVIHFIRQLVK